MKSAKQVALEVIAAFPDDISMSAILDEFRYLAQIEQGIREADAGDVVDNEEVMQELRAWAKSAGR